jgi:hypothetical protein
VSPESRKLTTERAWRARWGVARAASSGEIKTASLRRLTPESCREPTR